MRQHCCPEQQISIPVNALTEQRLSMVLRFFDLDCFSPSGAVFGPQMVIATMRGELWPDCFLSAHGAPSPGEIDIMENIGREPYTVHGTVHGPGYSGGNGIGAPSTLSSGQRFADAFHTFAVIRGPESIEFLVDNVHTRA